MCLACRATRDDTYWCKRCQKQMPRDNFDLEALQQLDSKNRFRDAICKWHAKDKILSKDSMVKCAQCVKDLPPSHYNPNVLRQLSEKSEVHNAVCLTCSNELAASIGSALLHCNVCRRSKTRNAFSIPMQKWVCETRSIQSFDAKRASFLCVRDVNTLQLKH